MDCVEWSPPPSEHCCIMNFLTGSDGSVSSSSRGHSPACGSGGGGIFANQSGQSPGANKHQGNTGSAGSYGDQGLDSKGDGSRYGKSMVLFFHMVAYYLLQIYLNLKFSFLFSLVFIFCSVSMGNKAPVAKREIRLIKNREAARECRRKKKEYIKVM